jgi:hypothetical protein
MKYKANVADCSEIRTKHSTHSENRVEVLNVEPSGTYNGLNVIAWATHVSRDEETALRQPRILDLSHTFT